VSSRLETLQVARLAPRLLGDSAERVVEYLQEQWTDAGGAADRAGRADLYYTVFTLEGLLALQAKPPRRRVLDYLESFGAGEALDLVHLSCLARCLAALDAPREGRLRSGLLQRLEAHRSKDGGYAAAPARERGTLYHAFLALGAHQDLGGLPPEPARLCSSICALAAEDGSYSNEPELPIGNTPSTAAAVTLLRHLGGTPRADTGDWLLARRHEQGGFLAIPEAPMPDLLSTATALHALTSLGCSLEAVREPCLDFVDTLWTGRAFCGTWADDQADSEYTFYALLALGHLSL